MDFRSTKVMEPHLTKKPCSNSVPPSGTDLVLPVLSSHLKGNSGESSALQWLLSEKYEFVASNIRTPFAQVDLLMRRREVLYLVEVKSRGLWFSNKSENRELWAKRSPHWQSCLNWRQKQRLMRCARYLWLRRHEFECMTVRGLLVLVGPDGVRSIPIGLANDDC